MFKLTFSQLILIYTALPLTIIFLAWIFIGRHKPKKKIDLTEPLLFTCPYCNHQFVNSKSTEDVNKCPSCNNFCRKN